MLLLTILVCGNIFLALGQSSRPARDRKPVAIDCDTALTSDLRIVKRPYKKSDNLFWGLAASANRPLISETNIKDYFRKIRPGGEVFLGKYFTPWISASANLSYSMQQEVLYLPIDTTAYSYHAIALSVEGQLCLNRLFSRYNSKECFLVYALANAGIQSSFAFNADKSYQSSVIDTKTHFSPLFKLGTMIEWRATQATSFIVRGFWTGSSPDFCGLGGSHRHRGMELSLGILKRLPNHYASREFQNCRGNEIYYFDKLEVRLLSDHKRLQKQFLRGKANAPVMAAEEDSILIFPYGYPYLTPRQESKLSLAANQLLQNPQKILVVDLYPIVNEDPKMTPTQAIQRCEIAIRHYLQKGQIKIPDNQLRFIHHPNQPSPIADQSIWVHGAFFHYVQ